MRIGMRRRMRMMMRRMRMRITRRRSRSRRRRRRMRMVRMMRIISLLCVQRGLGNDFKSYRIASND